MSSDVFAAWLTDKLTQWDTAGRKRVLREWQPSPHSYGYLCHQNQQVLDLASNDYLGLGRQALDLSWAQDDTELIRLALQQESASASRLVTGHHPIFSLLEREIAQLKGTEAALVFGSGYAANVGTISALVERHDAIFSDKLNHASIIDGTLLSRAEHKRYPHRDMQALEALLASSTARHKWIISDAVFSMDGTLAPLPELIDLKNRYQAYLILDEAHSGGVFGPKGAGLAHHLGVHNQVEVLMGTLGKAYGSFGAYIAGSRALIDVLINSARSFIFSTALPPHSAAVSLLRLRQAQTMNAERLGLQRKAQHFRDTLGAWGVNMAGSESQVIPWLIGDNRRTLEVSQALQQAGLAAVAIRPPTVPLGQARIRFSLSAAHSDDDLAQALATIQNWVQP